MLAVTLAAFSIFLYLNLGRSLHLDTDALLRSKAEGVEDSIDMYWETEKLEAANEGADTEVFNKVNNINFIKIAKHWVEERSGDPKLMDIIIQIFNADGTRIASSKKDIWKGHIFKNNF